MGLDDATGELNDLAQLVLGNSAGLNLLENIRQLVRRDPHNGSAFRLTLSWKALKSISIVTHTHRSSFPSFFNFSLSQYACPTIAPMINTIAE